jgi:hypothetical protein
MEKHMTDIMPELEGYVRQDQVNDIVKARLDRDRKQRNKDYRDDLLEEIHDELRTLRVMVATIKDQLDSE